MKTMIKLSVIIIVLCICDLRINACTSFAVYSGEIWYGMNFDYSNVDIKLSIFHIGSKKIFRAQFGSGGFIAGMNDSGLFTCGQILNYNNGKPTFGNGSNTLSIGSLYDYSINNLSTVAEITNYIGTKKIIPSWGLDSHFLFADKTSNAFVIEPFGSYNGITPVKDNFLVMTNLPNYDFIGMNYTAVIGAGADRYKTAFAYIQEHKSDFGFNAGFETLRRTIQSTGDYPTQISLLFDPIKMEIYFCLKRDFSKVWKISLNNETIETFSGFAVQQSTKLDETGIWTYNLPYIVTGIQENNLIVEDNGIVKIYPNPTSGLLNIAFSSKPIKNSIIEVYNIEGKKIFSKSFRNITNAIIDLTGNQKGLYLVKLSFDGEIISRKIYLK
ncbi:MAG: T9SS type A sorting domain-containing protein [Bacteroidia bacterium]|nr:T9SS type A sorting domain-containing protein [Bacteroidia bacterium]